LKKIKIIKDEREFKKQLKNLFERKIQKKKISSHFHGES